MKLVGWHTLIDDGYGQTPEFDQEQADAREGIARIRWPEGSKEFTINPKRKGNGVKPIKDAFIAHLKAQGWIPEHEYFDAHLTHPDSDLKPFVVEWETGNISSSHRAINRIGLGMLDGRISGGLLVVPTKQMYQYLTDRVGNFYELERYLPLWRLWDGKVGFGYFGIVTVEHDGTSPTVPLIAKGTDGRALL